MADRRVRYILEVDYDGESTILKAADDLREVDDAARQAGDGLGEAEGGFSKLQASVVTAQAALGLAQEGLQQIQQVAKAAYETLAEGAALADARGDFEDLAAGIGTTADAMEDKLGSAAAGLMTNAELIGQASEIMALNLGLTEEEIVRLSGVAAELELDWQTLMDTLNTGSTRGLKSMELNIDEVKGKIEDLKQSGMDADQAFTWAIIEAGEEKIGRVGKRSEEASGQLVILENIVADVQDEFARGAAEGFAGALGDISGSAPAAGDALGAIAYGVSSSVTGALATYLEYLMRVSPAMGQLVQAGYEAQAQALAEAAAREEQARAYQWVIDQYALYEEAQQGVFEGGEAVAGGQMYQGEVAQVYGEQLEWNARAAEWMADAQMRAAQADYTRALAVGELTAQQDIATAAAQAWAEYTTEATARGGDYFTQISQSGPATWDYADALYAAADAHGAGLGVLGEIAVQHGIITQAQADEATALAQQQVIIENLAGAAESGVISWENYAGAVEHAIEVLGGAYAVELGPRDMPEMEDRGFREGYQEQLEQVANEFEPIPIEVELEREAIIAAVEEARGIVTGFTSPQEAYEAVMSMNIEDVVAKSGEVKSLIEGIPDQKSITLDLTVIGMELIRELQALGVI